MWRKPLATILMAGSFIAAAHLADAQSYPTRAVRVIVPFAPGGSLDVVGRVLFDKMSQLIGQQVVMDFRPGASGNIGTELAARATPDGYTLLLNTLPLVVNPSLYRKLPFDVAKDLAPISLIGSAPFVLVIHPSLPVKSVKELVALAKAQPGKLNYASAGIGTNLHVAAELFKNLTKTDIVHIGYKGGGPALVATLSGETSLSFLSIPAALPHMQAGRLRALATTGARRTPSLPDLPTIAEAGVPGYEFSSWWGVLAPAGTPQAAIATFNDYVVKATRTPEVRKRFSDEGVEIIASSPAEFGAHIKRELARWAKVVKDNHIEPQ
jgi:tripartite-type tricarboxylate transporter receptor subunit TctC